MPSGRKGCLEQMGSMSAILHQRAALGQCSGKAHLCPARYSLNEKSQHSLCFAAPASQPREDRSAAEPRKSCLAAAQAPEAVTASDHSMQAGHCVCLSLSAPVKLSVHVDCGAADKLEIHGLQHIGFLIENLERSMEFYQGILGMLRPLRQRCTLLATRGAWCLCTNTVDGLCCVQAWRSTSHAQMTSCRIVEPGSWYSTQLL